MAVAANTLHELDETKLYPLRKDLFDVTADFAQEKSGTVAKIVYNLIDQGNFWGWFSPENKMASEAHFHAKCFKYTQSGPLMLISNFNRVCKAAGNMLEDVSSNTVAKTFREMNGMVGPTYDTAQLFSRIIFHIPKESIKTLGGVSGGSLTLWAGWNALDNVIDLGTASKNKTSSDTIQHMLKLAKHISYVVLGTLIVSSVFFNMVAAGIYFTSCTTSCAFFAVVQYYHKHLGETIKTN